MANSLLILESVAFTLDYLKLAEAENKFQKYQSGRGHGGSVGAQSAQLRDANRPAEVAKQSDNSSLSSLSQQIAKAREQIQVSLQSSKSSAPSSGGGEDSEVMRAENAVLKKQVEDLQNQVRELTGRVEKLEVAAQTSSSAPIKASGDITKEKKDAPADDDDVDLFGSDDEEEDAEAAKVKEQRLAEYAAKKSKKPALVAKSNVILDVKPWDDETDMAALEKVVRSIEMEGLLWGVSKLVPVGYGIKKLQINTVIVDDLVSVDELQEKIEAFEDFVQSVDIAAFNKI